MYFLRTAGPLLYVLLNSLATFGQTAALRGEVRSPEGRPLAYASVGLVGTAYGGTTDEEGAFLLSGLPTGSHRLRISMLGYLAHEQPVELHEGAEVSLGPIELEPTQWALQEVVVTGTMKETFVRDSPVKVEVITSRFLERNSSPTSLVESISLVNGVQEVVSCGVCFTNSISINGLPGAYTAILVDGAPMFGNLASVYGLNGIPASLIERLEVIKGPSSTLYGSEAVAGVINVITKDPAEAPLLAADLMGTSHRESFGHLALAPSLGKGRLLLGLDYAYMDRFEDANADGFSDAVHLDRYSLFSKWSLQRPDGRSLSSALKLYYEDRRNGVEDFLRDRAYRHLRGSDSLYGESIYTRRIEWFGSADLAAEGEWRVDYSWSSHWQDSYYGADPYRATQHIGFLNLIRQGRAGRHEWLAGLTSRYQYYDDNTVATEVEAPGAPRNQPEQQYIPGLFAQDEWRFHARWTLLGGARLDHYNVHGLIFSPRLNLRYKPGTWTTLRLNWGTGFRTVNLFTEDHAFITGQRSVEVASALEPERSQNLTLNFNHVYTLGKGQGSVDLDAFYTYFTDKILPDYSQPGKIVYDNSPGHAVSTGLGLTVNGQWGKAVSAQLSGNWQRVVQTEPDAQGVWQTRRVEFAPQWGAVAVLNFEWEKPALLFAYNFRLTGPMALPAVYDLDASGQPLPEPRPEHSPAFALHNLQITKTIPAWKCRIYGGMQNLFDYRQPVSPLTGFDDPTAAPGFSEHFDTAYAYSTLHGREFYLGLKWEFGGRE